MKKYIVQFKVLSVITKIPDAQSLFGAFCNSYKSLYGEQSLEDFLEKQYNNPSIIFSSLYVKDTLPLPIDMNYKYRDDNNPTVEDIKNNKRIKKVKYMSLKVFEEYKKDKELFEKNLSFRLNNDFQLINKELLCYKNENILFNYKVDSRTRNSSNEDLFKDQVIYFDEGTKFYCFVNIYDNSLEEMVSNVLTSMNYVFFGGYKSIGYNLFSFDKMDVINDIQNKKYGMLLSKAYISDDFIINDSFYSLSVVNNKYTTGDTRFKSGLVVLNEGSVVNTDKEFIGKIIKDDNNDKITYRYYIGYII